MQLNFKRVRLSHKPYKKYISWRSTDELQSIAKFVFTQGKIVIPHLYYTPQYIELAFWGGTTVNDYDATITYLQLIECAEGCQ